MSKRLNVEFSIGTMTDEDKELFAKTQSNAVYAKIADSIISLGKLKKIKEDDTVIQVGQLSENQVRNLSTQVNRALVSKKFTEFRTHWAIRKNGFAVLGFKKVETKEE